MTGRQDRGHNACRRKTHFRLALLRQYSRRGNFEDLFGKGRLNLTWSATVPLLTAELDPPGRLAATPPKPTRVT